VHSVGGAYAETVSFFSSLRSKLIVFRPAYIADGFQDLFKKLYAIRTNLETRFLVSTWSIRETDLYNYQRQLDRIDNSRNINGDFLDAEGNPADLQTQRVSLWQLLRLTCLVVFFIDSSLPPPQELRVHLQDANVVPSRV
jgi:hypothetical protein